QLAGPPGALEWIGQHPDEAQPLEPLSQASGVPLAALGGRSVKPVSCPLSVQAVSPWRAVNPPERWLMVAPSPSCCVSYFRARLAKSIYFLAIPRSKRDDTRRLIKRSST